MASSGEPQYRRYLSDRLGTAEDYLSAARSYVSNKNEEEYAWLHSKPYERNPGNKAFYTEIYQVVNLLQAMDIPYRGKILEVGSGPGWVTEILVALGFEVHGLEPSEEMIDVAKTRLKRAIDHWQIKNPPHFEFFCQTLEDCTLADDDYDAILFHAALHHIIDEKAGIGQCYRLLKPGGILGISESAWEPGNRSMEAELDEEMARFGTLENPYTCEYLDYLLTNSGFEDIQRYHSINGLIPEKFGSRTIESMSNAPAWSSNNVTAIKGGVRELTTRNHSDDTRANIVVRSINWDTDNLFLQVEVDITNTGKTTWLHQAHGHGWVTVAIRSATLGGDFVELERSPLPRSIEPGENVRLFIARKLPENYREVQWYVDLVNEEMFWFSTRGTDAVPISIS